MSGGFQDFYNCPVNASTNLKVDPPDPVVRGGDDEDDNRPIRWVSVTPATAKRDSSVKLGKVVNS